jgi:predicted lipoprotein with Yx(FWY)xxD motif
MKKISWLFLVAGLILIGMRAAVADDVNVKIMMKDNKRVGNYLADANGMTLYWKKHDTPGKSTCSGPCIEKWPAVNLSSTTMMPPKIRQSDFKTITREDGKTQSTFRGYPLYYFVMDKMPGDTNGQGVNNEFYVINPESFPPRDNSNLFGKN